MIRNGTSSEVLFCTHFLGGVTWELRVYSFGQARDKPVDKAADAGYSFLFEGQRAESLSMKERQCRPRQCMPV